MGIVRATVNILNKTKERNLMSSTSPVAQLELIKAVREHAEAHYNDGGWDVIVECWDDKQIANCIDGSKTVKGAIRKVAIIAAIHADRQADAENSAF